MRMPPGKYGPCGVHCSAVYENKTSQMSINQGQVNKPGTLIVVWLLAWNKAGYKGLYSDL